MNFTAPSGAKQWNDAPLVGASPVIFTHGDSITLTAAVPRAFLPRLAAQLVADKRGVPKTVRLGINGVSWNYAWPSAGYPLTMLQDAVARLDSLRRGGDEWLLAFGDTNGILLGGHSAATEYADLRTYVNARIAAGWPRNRIMVRTMLPRTGLSEVTRSAYNALVVADSTALGYKVARFDLDPNIGFAGQNLNTTWYLDGTHPTEAGHDVKATIIKAVMYP